jgi:outer membrane protein
MRPIIIAALITFLAPLAAAAQDLPARLTLEDALRIARSHNPQFRQALTERDVAEAQRRQGLGALLPTLSASFSTGSTASRALTGQGNYGEIVESEEYVRSRGSSANQGVSAQLTLFDGGANLNRIRESSLGARSVEARITAHSMQMRADVATRFYAALQAEYALRVEEQLLASAREQFTMTQRRFEIGSARREDLLGAEAQVANQEQQREQARSNLQKMRLQLLRELGVEMVLDLELVDETGTIFDPAGIDQESLVADALRSSPRIVEREAAVASRKHGVGTARGARLPRITAGGSFSRSTQGREFDALFDLNPRNRALSFSIAASLPLFSGFQTSYNIANAEAQLTNATEQLRAERLALETEVRTALIDLQNAFRSHLHAERSLALSQERLELTEERYRAGGAVSFIDLQNAIDGAARAERQAIDARFAFVNALVALEAKVGKEVRP